MEEKNTKKQKGSIVILGLIVSAGIIVISSEFALFVASALRQARTIDSSTLAYYAAESGVEHALYEVRQMGAVDLKMSKEDFEQSSWSYYCDTSSVVTGTNCQSPNPETKTDEAKFQNGTTSLEKQYFQKDQAVELPLYVTDPSGKVNGITNLQALKISWDGTLCDEICTGPAGSQTCVKQTPWIETTAVDLEGSGVAGEIKVSDNQDEYRQVEKDFQVVTAMNNSVIPLCGNQQFSKICASNPIRPMILRIKPYFCSLRNVKFTIHSDVGATSSPLKIPQYYMINPTGKFGGITNSVRAYIPQKDIHTGLFDFSLFSEEMLCKSNDNADPTKCN